MNVFESARQAVDAYSENAEAWKPDHNLAMACGHFEDLLLKGIQSLGEIVAYHQSWQQQVLSGQQEPNLSMDQAIWDMYAWWLRPCKRVKRELRFFERQGFTVEHAAEFRDSLRKLLDDRKGLVRPTSPIRPITSEHLQRLATSTIDTSRYDD
jgi:hypothetical protein